MKKIDVGIAIKNEAELRTPELAERITQYEDDFRDLFEGPFDNMIGASNWAIEFSQISELRPSFAVTIHLTNFEHLRNAVDILKAYKKPEIEFEYTPVVIGLVETTSED